MSFWNNTLNITDKQTNKKRVKKMSVIKEIVSGIKEIIETLRDIRQEMHKQSELMEFMVKKEGLNKKPPTSKKPTNKTKELKTII